MLYSVAVDDIEPNHWIAWVLPLPACFSSAKTPEDAITGVEQAIRDYFAWRAANAIPHPQAAEPIEIEAQVFPPTPRNSNEPHNFTNALFEHDARPMSKQEIQEAGALLECTHRDLLAVVQPLSDEQLNLHRPEDVGFGSIAKILEHIMWSEWWYFNDIERAFDSELVKKESVLQGVEIVRAHVMKTLPDLIGDARIVETFGEKWSARKVLRRTLWHERDHTRHITKLLQSSTPVDFS